MKKCSFCNVENPDDAVFCSSCGQTLPGSAPAGGEGAPPPPVYAPPPPAGPGFQNPQPVPPPPGYAPPSPGYGMPSNPGYGMPPAGYPLQKPGDPGKNWAGVLSLVTGILAIVPGCCWGWASVLLGLSGLVFGIIGTKSQHKGMSIAGIVCGSIAILWGIFVLIVSAAAINTMMPDYFRDFYDEFYDEFNLRTNLSVFSAIRNFLNR